MLVLPSAGGRVDHLAVAPGGDAVAGAAWDRGMTVWELPAGTATHVQVRSQLRRPESPLFEPGGRRVAWLAGGGRYVFDRDTGTDAPAPVAPDEWNNRQTLTGPGDRLIVRSNGDIGFTIRAFDPTPAGGWTTGWDLGPDRNLGNGPVAGTAAGRVFTCEYPHRGSAPWLLLVARSRADGSAEAAVEFPFPHSLHLAASPDGSCAVGAYKTNLVAWRVGEQPRVVKAVGTRKEFTGVAFHPSGRFLAATNNDATVRLYDAETWEVAKQFAWDVGKLRSVAFAATGTLAAAGAEDGRVVVWDVDV